MHLMSARVPRKVLRVGLLASLLWALIQEPGVTAAAGTQVVPPVILQPSDAQGKPTPGESYYQVTVAAGTTLQLYALVGNKGRKTATVRLAAVDVKSGVYGALSYNLPQQKRKATGSWVTLSKSKVQLPPNSGVPVAFSLRVPARTKPGQYVAGLTAFVRVPRPRQGRGEAIQIQPRRVVAIVVTVAGPLFGRFSIAKASQKRRPDGTYIVLRIRNTGNELLQGAGHLWMWQTGRRRPLMSTPLHLGTTAPGTAVYYPVRWTRHPARGRYTLKVVVWWNGGKTMRQGIFWVKK